ncbi:AMIN domain-containing protein [Pseudodesulfovibrio tunisiensis]|uniref:AMIN domain-containing protein n=1 Tax=Pseudodesulfovibrio tunisiensis TaxID=463192 RepID=UPI001FB2AB78|nr:AMIN domain-containing protein [Pseudodesulfovibrio tunisiensis]
MAGVLIAAMVMAVLCLWPGPAWCARDLPGVVRMPVDPTVLPPSRPEMPVAPQGTTVEVKAEGDGENEAKSLTATPGSVSEENLVPEEGAASPTAPDRTSASEAEPAPADSSAPLATPAPSPAVPAVKSDQPAKPASAPTAVPSLKVAEKPAPMPGIGVVTDVSLTSGNNGFVLKIVTDREIGDVSYFTLSGPARFVFDLRGKWTLRHRNVLRRNAGPVRHVVAGEHPDRLRFVVHLRTAPKARIKPEIENTGNSLGIVVRSDAF